MNLLLFPCRLRISFTMLWRIPSLFCVNWSPRTRSDLDLGDAIISLHLSIALPTNSVRLHQGSNLLWLDIKLVWPAKTHGTGIIVHSVVKTNRPNNLCGSTFLLCFFCCISTLVDGSCNNIDQLHCWQGRSSNGQMRKNTASLMDPCLACFRQKQKCYSASCMVSRAGTPRLYPHCVILVLEINDMTMMKKAEEPMNMVSRRSKWLYIYRHLIQGGIHMPVVLELKAM